MRRMSAIDHVVRGIAGCCGFHLLYCFTQRLSGRKVTVSLDGEGYGDGHAGSFSYFGNPDCLFYVIHCDGGHHVGRAVYENSHLVTVVALSLLRSHGLAWVIPVAARAQASTDHHLLGIPFELASNLLEQRDCPSIGVSHFFSAIA